MFLKLISLQWTEFWRGRNQAAGIISRVVMMLLILYFLLLAIGLGFFMKSLLLKFFPEQQPVALFSSFILYYFMVDFLARMQLQELPTLSIQPFLPQNIRKVTLVGFLNFKTLFSFFNVAPIFIFFPFTLTEIALTSGGLTALAYIISIVSLTIFNNFLAIYLKRKGGSNIWFTLAGVLVILLLAVLDYFGWISVRNFSEAVFAQLAEHSYLVIIFIGLAVFGYTLNSRYLYNNLYIEELSKKEAVKSATDYPFFNRFGRIGQLAALELKLILRHKRSRSGLTMSALFVFYGMLFYKKELIENNQFATMLFAAIFMTGIFQIVYGQFMFAWQSGHFDGLMSSRINFTNFIKAKFLLFTTAATFVTMLTMFYGFISWKLMLMHVAVYLYNIGFGSVIVLYFANYNKKRLDLSKGASFNWQGVGATQWIMGLPLIVIPFLIYLPFGFSNEPFWGLVAIAIFGLITLAMRDLWVKWLTKLFMKQRYKIAEGFRE